MRDRFVICRNPDQAVRERTVRDQLVAQLEEAIAGESGRYLDHGLGDQDCHRFGPRRSP